MTADNVKIAFCLPGGVNEDFIRNLIWQPQQQHQENNQQQQNNQFTEGVSKYIQEKACAEVSFNNKVSGLQPAALSQKRLRRRYFPIKL